MRLLFDTHILLADFADETAALPPKVTALAADPETEAHFSVASLWDIALKARTGKLKMTVRIEDIPDLLDAMGVRIVPIEARHAVVTPEPATRDPFDRMLLAQC